MKIKIFTSWKEEKIENEVNTFLEVHKDRIEVQEIKWKFFLEHYVMIIYKERNQGKD